MILEFGALILMMVAAFVLGYLCCNGQWEDFRKAEHERVLERERIVDEIFKKLKEGKP